jgi:hypothetical protein
MAAIAACSLEHSEQGMVTYDSAGVLIVEHGPEVPHGVAHWSFEAIPVLEIGKGEGDQEQVFTRIVQARALSGGELIVADRATSDFRIFDSTGGFVRRFGGHGSGPGEFRDLAWAAVDSSGSVTVYDGTLRRLSRFSDEGVLQRVIPVPSAPGTSIVGQLLGQFADGSILIQHAVGLRDERGRPTVSTGLVRDSIELNLLAPDGSTRAAIGRFPGTQNLRAIGRTVAMTPAPFGLSTVVAVADSVFYLGTQETFEIQIRGYRNEEHLHQIVRRRVPAQPVSASVKQKWQQQRDERFKGRSGTPARPELRELTDYQRLPDVLPSHGKLFVDRVGNLWVENYRPFPAEDTVTTWIVFSRNGTIAATAELPNAEITDILADRIVTVWHSEDGVPYVRVYRLAGRSLGVTRQ